MEPTHPPAVELKLSSSRTKRLMLMGAGWLFFGLGVLGAMLPVLPTTPFMLLALWAFSQSSERFHTWLYNHRVFGPGLQRWRQNRSIPRPVKWTAYASMTGSLSLMWFGTQAPPYAIAMAAAVMLIGAVYIARCPSQ